jgi:hypothetical protein
MTQVTTLSLFRFTGKRNRFWALAQMGLAPRRCRQVAGAEVLKWMGSGADNGFGIWPDWGTYGILGIWASEAHATSFFQQHPVFQAYLRHASEHQSIYMHNTMAHGAWNGRQPFREGAPFFAASPVAVITRATLRKRRLLRFWKKVPAVSALLAGQPGLRFAIGIGEQPLLEQATFSWWQSGKDMMAYAYTQRGHAEVIRRTRAEGWYKEELFARFIPYLVIGEGTILPAFTDLPSVPRY